MEYTNFDPIDIPSPEELEAAKKTAIEPIAPVEEKPEETAPQAPTTAAEQPQAMTPPTSTANPARPLEVNRSEGIVDTIFDALSAPGAGLNDYVIDELNKIPGLKLRKAPRYENEAIQAVRDLGGIILPFVGLRKATGGAIKAKVTPKLPASVQRSRTVKLLGEAGLDMGLGAYVDATVEQNTYNDNFEATLKKNWPKFWSWIPSDWATLAADSPDIKREKNVWSGMRFGVLTGSLEALARFHNAIRGSNSFTKYLFKNPKVAKAIEQPTEELGDDVIDVIAEGVAKRESSLDEVGQLNLFNQADVTKPVLGVDDGFTAGQSAMRDVDDMGVFGAMVDNWRIMNNEGTIHGRLANMTSEAALEYGLDIQELTMRKLVKGISKQLDDAGEFDAVLPNGTKLSSEDQLAKAADRLAEVVSDPLAEPGFVRALFDEYKGLAPRVKDQAAKKALKFYMDEIANLNTQRASAYLATSLAGQVSDFAEALKHMDDPDTILRAQEQIFNRMEFLMSEVRASRKLRKEAHSYARLLETSPGGVRPEISEEAVGGAMDIMAKSADEAKQIVGELRAVARERPMFLKPLVEAMELADGNVQTLDDLFTFFGESLPAIQKGIFDQHPEIPNQLVSGVYGVMRNSMLSAPSTFFKVFLGNKAMMLAKPTSHLAGAVMRLNIPDIKRGWYAYNSVLEGFFKGSRYAAKILYKASRNEDIVKPLIRQDLINPNKHKMQVLKSFAEAAMAEGEEGPMVLYNMAQNLQDLNDHVIAKFGPNAIAADDGFTRGVFANVRSRFEAYDEAMAKGLPIDEAVDKRAQELFRKKFNKDGLLDDPAAEYIANDIGMNLDSKETKAISSFLRTFPFLRPFMLFSTAKGNAVRTFVEFSPVNAFMKDYDKIIGNVPTRQFTDAEIEAIMTPRGLPATRVEFEALRSEYLGKVALGTTAASLALGMVLQGRIRGSGHYQAGRQKVRRATNWQPRTYQGLDGKWYSYEWLGPISDWITFMVDVVDAGASITQNDAGNLWRKGVFIFASALGDRQLYSSLEPLMDMVAGDAAGATRWAANMTSNLAPLSGMRRDIGRVINPAMREVNNDFMSLLRNNNNWLDMFDKDGALPDSYDWLTGKPVGVSENIFLRYWNSVSPMKVYEGDAELPERTYLQNIEYDAVPIFNKGLNGTDLLPDERSELFRIMGTQGTFRRAISRIMKDYPADKFRSSLQEARAEADPEVGAIPANEWDYVYNQLDMAAEAAKKEAFDLMDADMKRELNAREYRAGVNAERIRQGKTPVVDAMNMTNK